MTALTIHKKVAIPTPTPVIRWGFESRMLVLEDPECKLVAKEVPQYQRAVTYICWVP